MRAKRIILNHYSKYGIEDRINYIFSNFDQMEGKLKSFKEELIYEISEEKLSTRKSKVLDIGIRTKSSSYSDITANTAIELGMIADYIESRNLSEELLEDVANPKNIVEKLDAYWNVCGEYKIFKMHLQDLDLEDRKTLLSYLYRRKTIEDIALDLGIENDSARKRIYRMKKQLEATLKPYFTRKLA